MAAVWRRLYVMGRFLSTGGVTRAASDKAVKAPIQVFGLDGRYAHALFSAASKKQSLDKVEKELQDFQALMTSSPPLSDYILNPTIKKQNKKATLSELLKAKKYTDVTQNFFGVIAENNRLTRINGIIQAYNTIMIASRGEVSCTVTTAKPLDDKNLKELKTILQQFLNKNEKLNLTLNTDASVIGGMIIDIGDKYIDMSTATKIKRVVQSLEEAF